MLAFALCIEVPLFWVYMEKVIAPYSSTLAWKIPWMEEPGGLQSMGSLRVGQDCETSLSLFGFMHWRRKWQPTPVLLPGESHGERSLVGYSPWGSKESDTTEGLHFHFHFQSRKKFCSRSRQWYKNHCCLNPYDPAVHMILEVSVMGKILWSL